MKNRMFPDISSEEETEIRVRRRNRWLDRIVRVYGLEDMVA